MSKNDLKYLLKVIIFAALVVLAIKFFIYILPFLFVIFILMVLYDIYTKKKKEKNCRRVTVEDSKNKVMDAEIINERDNK